MRRSCPVSPPTSCACCGVIIRSTRRRRNCGKQRRDLEKRADVFLQAGMDSGTADAGVYFEAAMAAFDRRDHEEARGTLEAAIARFRDLPPERQGELLTLKLLAARNLFVMRRYADAKPYLAGTHGGE